MIHKIEHFCHRVDWRVIPGALLVLAMAAALLLECWAR